MLAFLGGVALLVPTSVLAACRLRIRGLAAFLVAVLTIAGAVLVAATLIVSFFDAYRVGPMLLLQLVLLVAVIAWWHTGGRLRPDVQKLPTIAELREAALNHKTVAVMVAAAFAATAVELFQGITIAPSTWDGLMYHLSRAALWIQEGGVFGLDIGTAYETQHQANGEMLYGWSMLLSDGDRFVALVQWLATLGCGAAVFWGARMLGFARSSAVFAAAIFITLPQVVVQASSTFVDVPAAFFVGAFALFGARALRDQDNGDLIVASLALGVAVGIKGTALLAAPGLILILGYGLYKWRPPRRFVFRAIAVLAVGLIALGSSKYVENVIEVGSPQGTAGDDATRVNGVMPAIGQTLWTFVDYPGFTGSYLDSVLSRGAGYFFSDGTDPGPSYVSEDLVSFGFIGWIVLLPMLAYLALARSAPPWHRIVALAAISYGLAHAVIVETFHWAPHTMVTGVLIAAPLLAWTARWAWVRHLVALAAVVVLVPVLLVNSKKPLSTTWTPGLSRADQQGFQGEYGDELARADALLAEDARIAYIGPRLSTWDYPFFGPHLDRYVYRVERTGDDPPSAAEIAAWVDEHDLDAVVWSGVAPPPGTGAERVGKIAGSQTAIVVLDPDGEG